MNFDKPPQNEKGNESKENLEIVKIPKIIKGSFSDTPGEAGIVYTTDFNVLADKRLFSQISNLEGDLKQLSTSENFSAILKPDGEKIFFGVTSPNYVNFPTLPRVYDQTCMTFTDSQNKSAGNIFSRSKMFGEYTQQNSRDTLDKLSAGEIISSEIEVGKPVEVSEKLLSTVEEYLKNGKTLYIESEEEIKLRGNEILDCMPMRILLCLYDKLSTEMKKEYSVSFGSTINPRLMSKIYFLLKPQDEQSKRYYAGHGHPIVKWNDLV